MANKKNAKAPKKAASKEKEIITKTALIDSVTKSVDGVNKKEVAAVINQFMTTVLEAVRQGDEVRLIGFGTFKTSHRKARTGRNPRTQEPMDIPASDSFAFHSNIKF